MSTQDLVDTHVERLEIAGERMAVWFRELAKYKAVHPDSDLDYIFTNLLEAYIHVGTQFEDIIKLISNTLERARERQEKEEDQT